MLHQQRSRPNLEVGHASYLDALRKWLLAAPRISLYHRLGPRALVFPTQVKVATLLSVLPLLEALLQAGCTNLVIQKEKLCAAMRELLEANPAVLGDAVAHYNIGTVLAQGGVGVEADPRRAVASFAAAVKLGSPEAMVALGSQCQG